MTTALITVRRQDALAIFHLADDDGKFFAVCCAGGLMKLLGRKLEVNEQTTVELTIKEIGK